MQNFPTLTLTAKPRRLDSLEAGRGVAAVLVVTLHLTHLLAGQKSFGYAPFGGLFQFGRAGVDFFFVLSGFIIAFIHTSDIGHPSALLSFAKKRLLRIYPAYWIVLLGYGALLAVSPTPDRSEQNLLHAINSFFLMPEVNDPILSVGWSLRHELLFYGVFGLAILNRRVGAVVFALWMLGVAGNIGFQIVNGTPYFSGIAGRLLFRGFNADFLFGIAAAMLFRNGVVWRPVALALGGGLLFLCTGLWESFGTPVMVEWPIRNFAYATGAACLIYGLAILDRHGRVDVPRSLVRLGAASYSIYLIHVPVLLVLEYALRVTKLLVDLPSEVEFIVLLAAAVASGIMFSEWIEQPILRLGRGVGQSRDIVRT